MKRIYTIDTLAIKICGMIDSSAAKHREIFRRGVIDSIVKVTQLQDATIEFIGYQPDNPAEHNQNTDRMIYEDCVFLSLNLHSNGFTARDNNLPDLITNDFIKVFEDNTSHHIDIDSMVVDQQRNEKRIEMISDWKLYLKHG